MKEINIDATNSIAGRLSSYAAKQALLGFKVNILNSEKTLITGEPAQTIETYRYLIREINTGRPSKGPFISRYPDRFLKRFVRGMLPHNKPRGREALKNIMCYIGIPIEFTDKKLQTIKTADGQKIKTKFITLGELCRRIGGKFNL